MNQAEPAERVFVLATTNRGKLAEFRDLLADVSIRLDLFGGNPEDAPEETGLTFVENALIKARHASRASGRPAIADDSGLCVAALDGAPGVRSARFAGQGASDHANVELLLERLGDTADDRRQAFFHCVIVALDHPDDPAPLIASGRWHGSIARAPSGAGGFGYDPVFVAADLGQTAAELDRQTKNRISHRGQASRALVAMLQN
jgi:XTP/dITP diphosphohydrolase